VERGIADDGVECACLERRALEFSPDTFEGGPGSQIHVRRAQSKDLVLDHVDCKCLMPMTGEAIRKPSHAAAEI
jgi:hypothetical protein